MGVVKYTADAQSFPGSPYSYNSATQEMDLGAKLVGSDGTEFRYVKVGATALVVGKLYDSAAMIANHTNIAVAAAAEAAATSVTVTLGATAVTANQYAGGKMIVNDVDGEGQTFYIKSHPAAALSTSLVLTLDTETPVVTALTTSSEVTLVPNKYNGVVIHPVTEISTNVGVAVKAVTAVYYGFVQTKGIVSLLQDATPAGIGLLVSASTTTAGCGTSGVATLPTIGIQLSAGISTEYNVTDLNLV